MPRAAQQTVLLIEYDAWLRSLLTNVLANDEGYAVLPAGDGQGGLTLAQQHPPNVIVLDLALPDHAGLEVLRQLKTQPPTRGVPTILLSRFTLQQLEGTVGMSKGAGTILQPFSLTELVNEIRQVVTR